MASTQSPIALSFCLFVCFITKSFLTYSFVLPTSTLSTICRPLSSYTCLITPETVNVGSSYSHIRGPGVGYWLSDRSNCSHWSLEPAVLPINPNIYTDQWEPIVIYHYITLTGRYTTMQPTLLTSSLQLVLVAQGVDNHSWGLYCRRCYCICVCWSFQSDIPLFTLTRPAKHSPNQGWESTHRLHLYPLGGVFYSPLHRLLSRRDLDFFTSQPMDDGEPWERFSKSRPNSLAGVVFRNRVLNSGHPSKYWPCRMTA